MRSDPDTLYEDNHLLVVDKPAGLLVQGDATGRPTLLEICKGYLKRKYAKPGNVYLGLVHRLDRPVSGVIVLARTSKAASRLSAQFRERRTRKTYLALVAGEPLEAGGTLVHHLGSGRRDDGRTPLSDAPFPGSREARMSYRLIERLGPNALLEIRPETGRRHQIRAQLAALGHPVLGDRLYGGPDAGGPKGTIALHAVRLEIDHPVGGARLDFTADPPRKPPWTRGRGQRTGDR